MPLKHFTSAIEVLEHRIAPANILDLSSLNGVNGVKILGIAASDASGISVSSAGDVNGDGLADFIIGASVASPGGISKAGAAYVVFGKKGGLGASIDLSTLNGTNGFIISGIAASDYTGHAVASAGDVNGDGFDDLIVGAYSVKVGANVAAGAAYVIFGKAKGFAANLDLSTLNGTNGFKLTGEATSDHAGISVSRAGDVNGDGIADLLVGAHGADPNGKSYAGATYVVFGKKTAFAATLSLGALNGTNGFKIIGDAAGDYSGISVSSAGDFNGDGFDDILIGAYGVDVGGNTNAGRSYVVFGKPGAFSPVLDLATLNGTTGFQINGTATFDYSGRSVSAAGDVNGDGLADIIIGASGAAPGGKTYAGSSYVVFGTRNISSGSLDLSSLNGTNGFKINGIAANDRSGRAVSAAGDVNGDGFGDLLIGAPDANSGAGATYVVYGKGTPFAATLELSSLTPATGLELDGEAANDHSGRSVSAVGDVNGDGIADYIIGAPGSDPGGKNYAGTSYLVYGSGPKVTLSKDGHTATFPDFDGDLVTLHVTKGKLQRADLLIAPTGGLLMLDLTSGGTAFNGAGITITAVKKLGGDGKVNVGAIDATGIDLGAVKINGDLGQIDAGDAVASTPGLVSLTVASLGAVATTQVAGTVDPFHSSIVGKLGTLHVAGAVDGFVDVTGGAAAGIGSIYVGSNLDGTAGGSDAGFIHADGAIGTTGIHGSVLGGADHTGIDAGGKLGTVTIYGDFKSDNAAKPAVISAVGNPAPIKPADFIAIAGVNVHGQILNSEILAGFNSTLTPTNATASIGAVAITGAWTASLLEAGGNMGNVSVGKSLTGAATHSGIAAGAKLGLVTIGLDLTSSSTATPVTISALGKVSPTTGSDGIAIAGLTVKGSILNARILAGYNTSHAAANADASIGAVKVSGNWEAASLVAGVADTTANGFGRNDTLIPGGTTLVAQIASVSIKGTAIGSASGGFYGITAERVGALTVGTKKFVLNKTGADDQTIDTTNNNFTVVDFA